MLTPVQYHGLPLEEAPGCATPQEAIRPAVAAANAATPVCRCQVTLTALRRRRRPARFPPNTEQSPNPAISTARARSVPDWAANQGEQRSLPDKLIRAPTWEQAGSE